MCKGATACIIKSNWGKNLGVSNLLKVSEEMAKFSGSQESTTYITP